jgi:uncharacterized membrane protein YccC
MTRNRFYVFLGTLAGLAFGLAAYRLQGTHPAMMNQFGIVAFASLGTSLGCLLAEPAERRR